MTRKADHIIPNSARLWEPGGNPSHAPAPSPAPSATSAFSSSVSESEGDAVRTCYTKRALAQYLHLSTRTLDRSRAFGLVPEPDLVVGRSPRWSPETIARWLKTRPKLPGRGKRRV
jgi:hypothetical protein